MMMILDIKNDPILQDSSQEPSTSSQVWLWGQFFLLTSYHVRKVKFGTRVKNLISYIWFLYFINTVIMPSWPFFPHFVKKFGHHVKSVTSVKDDPILERLDSGTFNVLQVGHNSKLNHIMAIHKVNDVWKGPKAGVPLDLSVRVP